MKIGIGVAIGIGIEFFDKLSNRRYFLTFRMSVLRGTCKYTQFSCSVLVLLPVSCYFNYSIALQSDPAFVSLDPTPDWERDRKYVLITIGMI
jgi:hypothetical protein